MKEMRRISGTSNAGSGFSCQDGCLKRLLIQFIIILGVFVGFPSVQLEVKMFSPFGSTDNHAFTIKTVR